MFHRISACALTGAATLALLTGCSATGHDVEKSTQTGAAEWTTVVQSQQEVLQAHQQFYNALNAMFTGDLAPMERVWSRRPEITLAGPFGDTFVGWDKIRGQFAREAVMNLRGQVLPEETMVRVDPDSALAYTFCHERGRNFTVNGRPVQVNIRAISVYQREDGQWRMIHHQADRLPELQSSGQSTGQ